jgi:hypothetical protein
MKEMHSCIGITIFIWLWIYLLMGYFFSLGQKNPGIVMWFWIFLPALDRLFTPKDDMPVEGICKCRKRINPGEKYCSICGGKIKDRLWRKRN